MMMTHRHWRLPLLLGLACGLILSGCGQPLDYELKGLAMDYHNFHEEEGRGPANVEELKQFSSTALPSSGGLSEAIDRGEFVVIWNAALFPAAEENEKYVLGYETKVPESGGLVLFGGGSVRNVSAEEFKTLPPIPQAE
jgi:hypothetical protein